MQGDLNRKTAEFDTIKAQLKSATLENERLKISGSNSQEYQVYNESLQDRMRILSEENDALLERLRQVGNEYAKTQEENSGLIRQLAELSDRLNETEINYSESKYLSDNVLVMKKNYEDEIERMNRDAKLIQEDNERLREDIDRLRVNLEKVHSDLQESRKTAMDLTLVYKSGVKDMEKLAAKETALIAELKRASLQSEEYASMYSQAQFEMDTMCRERLDMLATMKKLETEWVDYENRMITEQKKLNEALDREVQAKSDQHKMALCEEQLMNDIKRLESRIKQLQDRQQEIITVETEKFRHHYEQEKKRLSEELTTALFQKTEFASQVERAIREKRIAESELAKIKEYIPVELQKLQGTIEEYQTRIRRAENEKNDAIHQLESLQLKLSRENNRFEKEKQLLSEEINVLQQRIRNVERDSVETKQDRIQLFNKLHETEQKLNSQLELVEEMRLEAKNASEQMIRKFDFERRELEKRHEQSGAVIEKLNKEIQDLLTQQQKMAIKWKEEARLNTKNFERIVEELQERLQKADIRVKEANERNVKVSQLKDDLMAQTEDLKKKLAQIQTNLQITNNRASNSSQQVKILLEREHELINELKTLRK